MILSDLSGTITTGATSQQAAPDRRGRKFLYIGNPASETEDLYVCFSKDATADSPSITLVAGEPGIAWNGDAPENSVHVYAATTGHKFTMWEGY